MPFPGVNVTVTNGNLLAQLDVLDSVPALVVTVATPGLVGVITPIYTLKEAEDAGITETDESFAHAQIKEYYQEIGGKQLLYVFGMLETDTIQDMVDATNEDGIVKLMQLTSGQVNLIAIARQPSAGYDAGDEFLDQDVIGAITSSLPLCQYLQGKNTPIRILIAGRVANESVLNTFAPKTANNGYVGVVLGGTTDDGSAAVMLALARACKYSAEVKIGNGQNGALVPTQIYIGTKRIEDRSDVETLHDQGFITFMRRPGAAGYYFGVDYMCENQDFYLLVRGRIIDKAQRIAAAAYLPFIETSIRVETNGNVNAADATDLEATLDSAIRNNMQGQISNVKVEVPLEQDVINTSTLLVNVAIQPLGYLTYINVTIGLTTSIGA